MKKGIKLGLIGAITAVSGTTLAAQASPSTTTFFVEEVCSYAPWACSVSLNGAGSGDEPKMPKEPPKDEK